MCDRAMLVTGLYERRKFFLQAVLWLLLGLGMAFSIATFDCVGKCYTIPCAETLTDLLRVNAGASFQLLLTGFLFILQPVYGIWFLRVRCSELVGGAYMGASGMTSLLALMTCAKWGSVAGQLADADATLQINQITSMPNTTFGGAFSALEALAAAIFVLSALSVVLLANCREAFCEVGAHPSRTRGV